MTSQLGTVTDFSILSHITRIAEVIYADAAADEQLAGQRLQLGGGAPADSGGAGVGRGAPVLSADLFPHLKIINKDKPHGAIMITSRTWKCDPYLGWLAHEVIMSSTSMAQLLQHSDVLRARYAKHVSALQMNPVWCSKMTTLSAAKHRFDSWTKPFSRLCLTFEAALTTPQDP